MKPSEPLEYMPQKMCGHFQQNQMGFRGYNGEVKATVSTYVALTTGVPLPQYSRQHLLRNFCLLNAQFRRQPVGVELLNLDTITSSS